MPVRGVKFCGARCRTKGGAPCINPAMKNGRCRMHGGALCKKETHGRTTLRAIAERKRERAFLREMKALHRQIKEAQNEYKNPKTA